MEQMEAAPLTAYYHIKCRSVTGMKFLVSNICNIKSHKREAKGIKEGRKIVNIPKTPFLEHLL
jgi:hypothetical protein